MKEVLIIYPHFPPSNLAGVHRPRLFATHLPSFGWEPTILTVDEKYYEENLDFDLVKLLPSNLRIEKVSAFSVGKLRLIGDIGLRGFVQLYRRAKQMINTEHFDFLYIPIPSFYCALLGRWLHSSTKIKYGIDYIDPWVHHFPGSEKRFSRHWWSMKLAGILEPIAVKKASLITGVAEGYYKGVQERNPLLLQHCLFAAMPYGGENADHQKVRELGTKPYLFPLRADKLQLVYAGAMLPKALGPLTEIFRAVKEASDLFKDVEFHFIGTGKSPNDKRGYRIKPIAEEYGLWQKNIFEYPARIPYFDVLVHLDAASGIFILGSTEPHYTPSKVYQAILSGKPIIAVLHHESRALALLKRTGAGITVELTGKDLTSLARQFTRQFERYKSFQKEFSAIAIDLLTFRKFSAYEVTKILVTQLEKI